METKTGLGLKPLLNQTMADKVELSLREYFKNMGFKPGDALPKELEIAEELGVSRNVVREALSRFRMLGIIESKKKRGMVLSNPDLMEAMERVLDPYLIDSGTQNDLSELRLVLEIGLADLLFARKTKKDIQKLKEIVKNELEAKNDVDRIQFDIQFHSALYQISGNQTLLRFQKVLFPIFSQVLDYESKFGTLAKGPVTHSDLIKLLETGSPAEFRDGMHQHLKPYLNFLLA